MERKGFDPGEVSSPLNRCSLPMKPARTGILIHLNQIPVRSLRLTAAVKKTFHGSFSFHEKGTVFYSGII